MLVAKLADDCVPAVSGVGCHLRAPASFVAETCHATLTLLRSREARRGRRHEISARDHMRVRRRYRVVANGHMRSAMTWNDLRRKNDCLRDQIAHVVKESKATRHD
jgi:hypothetical protein